MSVFAVEDLRVTFRQRHGADVEAVKGVSFAVEAGRTLAIVGESGSGKSVSLLAATGLLNTAGAVVQGRALHHGTDLVGASAEELRRLRGSQIGFVFQDPQANLHPLKTVGAQVAEAITSHRREPRRQVRARVLELLDEVGIREPRRRIDDYPVQFSGGMRQRVMIAMALALNPGLLIADEPTTALDVTVQASILDLLRGLQRDHGTAIIFVSHDLAVVSDIADDIVVMRGGVVVESGDADEVYGAPAQPYTRELLDAAVRGPAAGPDVEAGPDTAGGATLGDPLLQVSGVGHHYGHRRARADTPPAVSDVSFDLRRGEILGLVGESGSGKSTLGRIVAGLLDPSAGSVSIDGSTYTSTGRRRARPRLDPRTRGRIQVVFQDPYSSLNPRRRVRDILAEPFDLHRDLAAQELEVELEALVNTVELAPSILNRFPAHLSGGQRQRVAVARALALSPDVVVADEAVSALDITTQSQILALIRRLREERGISFLFISHDLGVVSELCDRVLVLNGGRVVEQGRTEQVFSAARDPYTRLLIDSIPGKRRGLVRAGAPTGEEGRVHV
ncbi:ABC transporter ATP-binding protein [Nocardioides sp. CER19]|uniref:ABC transporter ATP-binding protein n=1 Tax=Nocardioides sp. CER19 TaxID=3038538 RepID=UPI00244B679C|nr:ABC transporter ATP-binding protein [Nocardioides sp. CER19]MDH2414153.1 ABC transporter ATP-binding protein [Nocardioides sp. CER19]